MTFDGWKTVVINKQATLSYKDNCLFIEENEPTEIPITQIRTLIIESIHTRISAYLLNQLTAAGITVLLCDERHMLASHVMPLYSHHSRSGRIKRQLSWEKSVCDAVWSEIVKEKITMQNNVVKKIYGTENDELKIFANSVLPGDPDNKEAQAAKIYFPILFGRNFSREQEGEINASLNFGYHLILSEVVRKIGAFGYLTEIGIHHCSEANPYNLACDIMEPFRPFVDLSVQQRLNDSSFQQIKSELLYLMYQSVQYNKKAMALYIAIGEYVEDILNCMNKEKTKMKMLGLRK